MYQKATPFMIQNYETLQYIGTEDKVCSEIDTLSAEVKMQLGPNLVPACIRVADTSQMSASGAGRAGHTEAVRFTKCF